jgi:hypothetical protein
VITVSERDEAEPPDRKPWERADGETSRSFEGFVIYRDLGGRRSLSKVAQTLSISKQSVAETSLRFGWVARALAWDDEQDRIRRDAHNAAIVAMNNKHAEIALSLQGVALKKLQKINEAGTMDELDAVTVLRYLTEAAKMERVARGEPETIQEHRHGVDDKSNPKDKLARVLARLATRIGEGGLPDSADSAGGGDADAQLGVLGETGADPTER